MAMQRTVVANTADVQRSWEGSRKRTLVRSTAYPDGLHVREQTDGSEPRPPAGILVAPGRD